MSSPILNLATTPPLDSVLSATQHSSYVRDTTSNQEPLERPVSLLELRPSHAMVEATQVIYASLLDDLHRTRFCRHCRKHYRLWDTLGRQPCWGHPGRVDQRRACWMCCGRPLHGATRPGFIDGCMAVDHLDAWVHRESHQHSADTTTCLPLPVFLLMPDKETRSVSAVYHVDHLPVHYKKAFVRARYGDMLEEEEEEEALEEWTTEPEESDLADYDETTFLWPQTDLRLDQFHVILTHTRE